MFAEDDTYRRTIEYGLSIVDFEVLRALARYDFSVDSEMSFAEANSYCFAVENSTTGSEMLVLQTDTYSLMIDDDNPMVDCKMFLGEVHTYQSVIDKYVPIIDTEVRLAKADAYWSSGKKNILMAKFET